MAQIPDVPGEFPDRFVQFPPVDRKLRGGTEQVHIIAVCNLQGQFHNAVLVLGLLHQLRGELHRGQVDVVEDDWEMEVQLFLQLWQFSMKTVLNKIPHENAPEGVLGLLLQGVIDCLGLSGPVRLAGVGIKVGLVMALAHRVEAP